MTTSKLSATLDVELIEQVRGRVGPRGVSAFLNQAVAEKLQRERVLELLDALDVEHGPVTSAERRAAERKLAEVFVAPKTKVAG